MKINVISHSTQGVLAARLMYRSYHKVHGASGSYQTSFACPYSHRFQKNPSIPGISVLVRIAHVTMTSSTLVTRLSQYSLQCSHSHKITSCINYVTTHMLHSRMHIKCSSLHSSHMELLSFQLSFHNLVIVFLAN